MSNITPFYNNFKSKLVKESGGIFEEVTGSRREYYDFIVFGIKEDVFYKIITPKNKKNVLRYINYMKMKFTFQTIKRKYVLIILNKNLVDYDLKEIKLN